MKLWLDDKCLEEFVEIAGNLVPNERFTPEGWIGVTTAREAIRLLKTGEVEEISFDHDLGEQIHGDGYIVAKYIEKYAFNGTLNRMKWDIHSANPVGAKNITMAMQGAERWWKKNEVEEAMIQSFEA